MADETRRIPPLAIIVMVVLVALVVIAFVQWRGTQRTPSGILGAPQKGDVAASVMPQQSTVPNAQAPASTENGAVGHQGNNNEPGGPANTANVVASPR